MWQAPSAGGTDHGNPQLWLDQHSATVHACQGLKQSMRSAHEKETLALWCCFNPELCSGKYHTSKVKLWVFFWLEQTFLFGFCRILPREKGEASVLLLAKQLQCAQPSHRSKF